MKKIVTLFLIQVALFGCSNNHSPMGNLGDSSNAGKIFPVKPLIIIGDNGDDHGPGDIRISIINISENDTAKIYTATSTFENKNVGFLISIPKAKESKQGFGFGITLNSSGKESDNLLQALAKIYKQKIDTTKQFIKTFRVSYVNLIEMGKSLGAKDEPYTATNEYKLFFEHENDYAELYLNINAGEHWIELNEKDQEYRPLIIKFLTE